MKKSAKRKAVRQRKSAKKETPVPSDKTAMDEFRDRLIQIQTETGLIKSHVSIALERQEKALKSALISQMRAISTAMAIGRAHVCIPVTNAHLVCRLLLANNNSLHYNITIISLSSEITT